MWLNEKEEEEVNYDWSERNTNMAAKKENYSVEKDVLTPAPLSSNDVCVATLTVVICDEQGLMRELELREKKMNNVQATGDKLLRDGHPARQTVEVRLFKMEKDNLDNYSL